MAQDIGCEDFPERRLIVLAVTVFSFDIPRACLSSSCFAGDAQLVRRVSEGAEEVSQCLLDS